MVGVEWNNYMYMYFQVMIYRFVTRNSVEERVCEVRVGGASNTCMYMYAPRASAIVLFLVT